MIIESIIAVAVVGTAVFLFWQSSKETPVTDVNKDGKTDVQDASAVLEKAVEKVVDVVDVNDDGKVSVADAEAVMEKITESFKEKLTQSDEGVAAPVAEPKKTKSKAKTTDEKKAKPKKPKKPKLTVAK